MRTPNPHHRTCPVAAHAHPLARKFFEIADAQRMAITDVAQRAGLSHATLVRWKTLHSPTVPALEAALNVLGYELRIVRRRDPSDRPYGRPGKETTSCDATA